MTSYWVSPNGIAVPIRHAVKGGQSPLFLSFHGIDANGNEQLTPDDGGYARAYATSVLAWRCINLIANTLSSLPLKFTASDDKPLPRNHPLVRALGEGRSRWWRATTKDWLIFGRAFSVPVRGGLRRLNPQTVEVEKDISGISGFKQIVNGQVAGVWKADEIVYFFDYDPEDDLGSVPAMMLALRAAQIETSLETFVKMYFENNATPAGILSTEQMIERSERERVQEEWQRKYGGSDNAHKVSVLSGGLTYQAITPTIKDLVVNEIGEASSRRICQAFGVPMTLALATDAANYATAKEQRQSLYTETVLPLADVLCNELNLQYVSEYGDNLTIAIDRSEIEVLQEDKTEVTQRAQQGFSGGFMTLNEARDMENLEPVAGGDFFLIGGQPLTVEDIQAGNFPSSQPSPSFPFMSRPLALPEPTKNYIEVVVNNHDEPETLVDTALHNEMGQELKRWKNKLRYNEPTAPFAVEFLPSSFADFIRQALKACHDKASVKDVFTRWLQAIKQDEDYATPAEFEAYWRGIGELFQHIEDVFQKAWVGLPQLIASSIRDTGALPDLTTLSEPQIAELVGTAEQPGALVKIFLAGAARGNELLENHRLTANPSKATELTIAWDLINNAAVEWARNYAAELIKGINTTTQTIMQEKISQWIESGQPLDDLAKAIEGDLQNLAIPDGWSQAKIAWATSPQRAALIAQTETTRAFYEGVATRWQQAGVRQIRWRTQNDGHVCPICKGLNNKTGDITEGVKDDDGTSHKPPAHGGCRCFAAPVTEGLF